MTASSARGSMTISWRQDPRRRARGLGGGLRILEGPRQGLAGGGAGAGEGAPGLFAEGTIGQARDEILGERPAPLPPGGPDRNAGDLGILVLDEPPQRLLEHHGQALGQAGRPPAPPLPPPPPPP